MRKIVILLAICLWAPPVSAGDLHYQFERGIAAYKSGDYSMAGQKLKFVLEQHPNNLTALYYYGMSKHQLGSFRSAQKTLEYAHRIAPNVPEIRVSLVRLYVDMNEVEKANTHLTALQLQRHVCGESCEIGAPLDKAIADSQVFLLSIVSKVED